MIEYILLGITSYVLYQFTNKPKYNKQVKKQKVENIIEKDTKLDEEIKQEEIKLEEIEQTSPLEYLNKMEEKINNIIKETRSIEYESDEQINCCECNNSLDLDDYDIEEYSYLEDQGYLCNKCYYNNLGNYFDCIKCFGLYDACNITCVDKCDGEFPDPICNNCFNPEDAYCCENCDTYIYYNDEQVDLCSECLYWEKKREKEIKLEEIKLEEIKETKPIEYLNRTLEKINNIIKRTIRLENLNKMEAKNI